MNISSIGDYVPRAYENVYSSCKHTIHSFSIALPEENRDFNISEKPSSLPAALPLICLPNRAWPGHFPCDKYFYNMTPKEEVRRADRSYKCRKRRATNEMLNYLSLVLVKLLPGKLLFRMATKAYKANIYQVDTHGLTPVVLC